MRSILLGSVLALAASGALAQPLPPAVSAEARDIARSVFVQIDSDGSGLITRDEMIVYAGLVVASMDADQDGVISWEEYDFWGFGFGNVAAAGDLEAEYGTAQRILFDLWDRDNDGLLTGAAVVTAFNQSFDYADLEGDGALDEEEFLLGFITNIAYRAVFEPR